MDDPDVTDVTEVTEVTDELYAGSPADFIRRRDELAARARAAGDRDVAAQIRALRRPTTVAWLANQLARQHGDELGPLLELGAALREATATLSGADLRTLSRQRSVVVGALLRQARALAASLGRPASDAVVRELEQTLLTALADPEQAAELEAGRLGAGLEYSESAGLSAGLSAGVDPPTRPSRALSRASQGAVPPDAPGAAVRRAALEHDLEQAWQKASAAKDAHAAAAGTAAETRRQEAVAQEAVQACEHELERAQAELAALQERARTAAEAQTHFEAEVKRARALVGRLQHDLDDLAR